MAITLFPCGTVPCPCPECETFTDLSRENPNSRLVYYRLDEAVGTLTGGVVTWIPVGGGDPVTAGMGVVGPASQLCLGQSSIAGQIVFYAVPYGATITQLGYTYTPAGGGTAVTVLKDVVASCTDGATEISATLGALPCDAEPEIKGASESCPPCSEATGTSSISGNLLNLVLYRCPTPAGPCPDGFVGCEGYGCVQTLVGTTFASSVQSATDIANFAASWTPGSTARPCNWLDIAFSTTLTVTQTYSHSIMGSVTETVSIAISKVAGSLVMTTDRGAYTRPYADGFDGRLGTWSTEQASDEYAIACTGYRLRLLANMTMTDVNIGGARYSTHGGSLLVLLEPVA